MDFKNQRLSEEKRLLKDEEVVIRILAGIFWWIVSKYRNYVLENFFLSSKSFTSFRLSIKLFVWEK